MITLATGKLDSFQIHALVLVVGGVVLYLVLAWKKSLWVFNRLMIWGAVLGIVINSLIGTLIDVSQHKGTGVVSYGDGGGEISCETVSEETYKRKNYVEFGFLLFLVLLAWYLTAKAANKES